MHLWSFLKDKDWVAELDRITAQHNENGEMLAHLESAIVPSNASGSVDPISAAEADNVSVDSFIKAAQAKARGRVRAKRPLNIPASSSMPAIKPAKKRCPFGGD